MPCSMMFQKLKERGVLIGLAHKFMPESYLQMQNQIQAFLLFKEEKDASSAFFCLFQYLYHTHKVSSLTNLDFLIGSVTKANISFFPSKSVDILLGFIHGFSSHSVHEIGFLFKTIIRGLEYLQISQKSKKRHKASSFFRVVSAVEIYTKEHIRLLVAKVE